MFHATSAPGRGVVLDWRHAATGPPEPCVFGDGQTVCRSPVQGVPCHKACAETWINTHAADAADLAQLIRDYTPVSPLPATAPLALPRPASWSRQALAGRIQLTVHIPPQGVT